MKKKREPSFALRMARWSVWITVACVLAIWLVLSKFTDARDPSFGMGGDFTLQSATGPVSTEQFRGKVVVVYFGYTFCPDICPTTLADTAAALKKLSPDEMARTRVLFVSVDPERDTKERLAEYATYFHPNVIGVTASLPELAQVVSKYGASFAKRPLEEGEGYSMDHPAALYVLDPKGKLVSIVPHGADVEHLRDVIRAALRGDPIPKKVYQ